LLAKPLELGSAGLRQCPEPGLRWTRAVAPQPPGVRRKGAPMPIKLTIVGGPLDGQVFEYGIGKPAITIGRYPDCDIVFPPDMIAVSRSHLTIASENARYLLRPHEPVYIGGHEALRDDPLPVEGELALGKPDGPRIRFEWSTPHDMPRTEDRPRLAARSRGHNPLRDAQRALAMAKTNTRRVVLLAAGVAVLTAGIVAAFLLSREDPIEARILPQRQSVYLVLTRTPEGYERGSGTAWVIAPGILATNAHVAEGLRARGPGVKALVRSNVPPYHTLEVKSMIVHPHYRMFSAAVVDYGPAANGSIVNLLAYDTALLKVDSADAAKLAPPLRVAGAAALQRLGPQSRIAYIGYPQESLAGAGTVPQAPNPQIKYGEISAVTDFFLIESHFSRNHLVTHSLAGHGGASGSPIFNSNGDVVALFNAANMISADGSRQPSAALINFGQRADLAIELLTDEAARKTPDRIKQWREEMARFERGEEHFPKWFFAGLKAPLAPPLLETKLRLGGIATVGLTDPADGEPTEVQLPGKGQVLFIAHHLGSPGMQLEIFRIGEDGKRTSINRTATNYRFVGWTSKVDQPVKVAVAVRGRRAGEAVLRVFFVATK
jgi:hypothetical protein